MNPLWWTSAEFMEWLGWSGAKDMLLSVGGGLVLAGVGAIVAYVYLCACDTAEVAAALGRCARVGKEASGDEGLGKDQT